MALAQDLLQQARELASLGTRKPRQANLRRAVSSAYYSLFHLLVQDAAKRLSPTSPKGLAHQVTRSFAHSDMKQACNSIVGSPSIVLSNLQPSGFSPELRSVARTFVDLQEERHDADYDLTLNYTRVEVLELVNQAQTAFALWQRIRQSDEANVFCAALLFHRTWGR